MKICQVTAPKNGPLVVQNVELKTKKNKIPSTLCFFLFIEYSYNLSRVSCVSGCCFSVWIYICFSPISFGSGGKERELHLGIRNVI